MIKYKFFDKITKNYSLSLLTLPYISFDMRLIVQGNFKDNFSLIPYVDHFYSYRLNLTLFFFEVLICLLNSEFDLSKFIFVYFDEHFHEDSLKKKPPQFSFSF